MCNPIDQSGITLPYVDTNDIHVCSVPTVVDELREETEFRKMTRNCAEMTFGGFIDI